MARVWQEGALWKFPSEGVARVGAVGAQIRLGAPRRLYVALTREALLVYPDAASAARGEDEAVDLSVPLSAVERISRGIDLAADVELDPAVRNRSCLTVTADRGARRAFFQASSPAERDSWFHQLQMLAFEQGVPPPHVLAHTLVAEAATCTVDRLSHLLSFGADLDGTDAYGATPLMEAARADNAPVVTELLARGATCAAVSAAGEFALGIAAFRGSVTALHAMLRGGAGDAADPNVAGPDGRTALHLAACSPEARPDVVVFLMDHGASPLVMDSEGQTPLHALCARQQLDVPHEASQERVAEWRQQHAGQEEACAEALIRACPAAMGWRDGQAYTPPMLAAWHGHAGCLKALLAAGADALAENGEGHSVVTLAKSGGHHPCMRLLGLVPRAQGDLVHLRGAATPPPAPRRRDPETAAQSSAVAFAGAGAGAAHPEPHPLPPLASSDSVSDSEGESGSGGSSDSGYLRTPRGPVVPLSEARAAAPASWRHE